MNIICTAPTTFTEGAWTALGALSLLEGELPNGNYFAQRSDS